MLILKGREPHFILTDNIILQRTLLWRKYVKEVKPYKQYKGQNKISQECCCLCEQTSEHGPQTPTSLLQNEYFQTKENDRNSSTTKLIELQNNNNQNISETSEIL